MLSLKVRIYELKKNGKEQKGSDDFEYLFDWFT